jgi:uncharacterized membrane protein
MAMTEQTSQANPSINVATKERINSVVGGAVLLLIGLRRRTTFGALMAIAGGALIYRGVTGHSSVYAALGKNTAEEDTPEPQEFFEHGVHVEQSVTIDKPADEIYRFWRQLDNLPRFMNHLESVTTLDDNRSHWVCAAPAGRQVEWDAEIINDEPNKLIAWRSTENADVHSTGSVRFLDAASGNGTDVHVILEYLPPAGQVGRWIAKLFGEEPDQQVRDDLRQLKQVMESRTVPAE